MAAVPQIVSVQEVGIDLDNAVNIEIDFDSAEAREILSFMDRYHIPTYADAVRLMAMIGAGSMAADPDGTYIRIAGRLLALALCVLGGMLVDDYTGW